MMYGTSLVLILLLLVGFTPAQERFAVNSSISPVMTVLSNARISGSLEYSGRCDLRSDLDYPRMKKPADYGGSPVPTLSAIFADDPKMEIREEPHGMIRMKEGDVSEDILNVRIDRVIFKADPQKDDAHALDNPGGALWFILRAPEVRAFMKGNDIKFEYNTIPLSMTFSPHSEHISGELRNVSLSQALDHILKTYPGLWIYKTCSDQKRGRLVFFEVYSAGGGWGPTQLPQH
jgi:hypothetical protein